MNFIQISTENNGILIDLLSLEIAEQYHSVFCLNFTLTPPDIYIELFGFVLIDTYERHES